MKHIFKIIFLFSISLVCWKCVFESDRNTVVPGPGDIQVSFEVVSNAIADRPMYRSRFILENKGNVALNNRNWTMYYNQVTRLPIAESVPDLVTIEHINGDFFRMAPRESFRLDPGEIIEISFESQDWLIKKSDAPSGVYFVYTDKEGKELSRVPVDDLKILPFTRPEQINRFKNDETPIPTPEWQFDQNEQLSLLPDSALQYIIPKPINMVIGESYVSLDENLMIHHDPNLSSEAGILARHIELRLGTRPMVMESETTGPGIISLKLGAVEANALSTEAYHLASSRKDGIIITGSDPAGVFYGIQSLIGLFPVEKSDPSSLLEVPEVQILDAPAFAYRGMHVDVARNFHTKATVLKFLDLMAYYKLNKFHFHLTDDEGWRLEIEELPELTEIGAFRGHTLDDKEYLAPAYGSGPFPDPEISHGSGYYTREDFLEILEYAAERHIEVIPEVNMPGHARAAIKAMEHRYRKLMEDGREEEARKYLLSDPDDESDYISAQLYNDNVICVCKEAAYAFYETVIDDIIEMYDEAGLTLKIIHTGGDEVPHGAWERSPLCNDLVEQDPGIGDYRNLQPYFFRRLVDILEARDLTIAGWEEVAMTFLPEGGWKSNPEFAGGTVIPYVWNSLWGNQDLGYRLANGGYPVVLCNVNNFYFDLAYNKDPEEPGAYWGGFVDTKDAFRFIPYDLFKSMDTDVMGNAFDADNDFRDMERLRPDAYDNIAGLQGELWSETVKGQAMMEYYTLPKMLGLSERAWVGTPSWAGIEEDELRDEALNTAWNQFANTIGRRELPRLDYIFGGYQYRIPPPGARVSDGMLEANSAFPGLIIRYTTDGSEPDTESPLYRGPVEVNGPVKLRAFSPGGSGSRTVEIK